MWSVSGDGCDVGGKEAWKLLEGFREPRLPGRTLCQEVLQRLETTEDPASPGDHSLPRPRFDVSLSSAGSEAEFGATERRDPDLSVSEAKATGQKGIWGVDRIGRRPGTQ